MKTAMQELYEDLERFKITTDTISIIDVQRMIGHYANEKEKQQIIEAYKEGWKNPSKFREHGSTYYYENKFKQ